MQRKPNIVFMNCDDLGYGDLGCYGSPRNKTPHLDRMAAEGIRLTDFYMASPVCSPSRAGMLTGCLPPRVGVTGVLFPGQPVGLSTRETTLAGMLKKAGYATALVGKWHCGDQPDFLPTRHGFDHYFGIPYSNDMGRQRGDRSGMAYNRQKSSNVNYNAPSYSTDLADDLPPLPLMYDETVQQAQPDQAALTERYVDESIRFIRANREKPFFLYLAHMYVHLPIYAPEHFMKQSENGRYGAGVACVDWAAGVLMEEIRKLGLEEDTLFVFTSDNGSRCRDEGGSNDPLRGTKATTWEGGMRLPCILRWKGTLDAGRVDSGMMGSIDFLPTFARLTGVELPEDRVIDGVDCLNWLRGETDTSPRNTFYYYHGTRLQAVRQGPWKLHFCASGAKPKDGSKPMAKELYHLGDDIGESTNVYDQHPDVVKQLTALADAMRAELGDSYTDVEGSARRPIGRVENPDSLTHYDANEPYIIAEYDLSDSG